MFSDGIKYGECGGIGEWIGVPLILGLILCPSVMYSSFNVQDG